MLQLKEYLFSLLLWSGPTMENLKLFLHLYLLIHYALGELLLFINDLSLGAKLIKSSIRKNCKWSSEKTFKKYVYMPFYDNRKKNLNMTLSHLSFNLPTHQM